MKYMVDIDGKNRFYGLMRNMFAPGETVEFLVPIAMDLNYNITSDSADIIRRGMGLDGRLRCCFIMPERDVKVSISTYGSMTAPDQMPEPPEGDAPAEDAAQDGRRCPDCHATVGEGKKFCPECGCKLF